MSELARITLVRGGEQALVDRAIASTVAGIRQSRPDVDRESVDASTEDAVHDFRNVCAPTLFGSDVIVVVTGLQSADDVFADALTEVLADQPENVWLVLHHDATAGGKKLLEAVRGAGASEVECLAVKKGKAAIAVISQEFARRKRRATSDAINVLYESCLLYTSPSPRD